MTQVARRFLVTGAEGFIGKNLVFRLCEIPGVSVLKFVRGDDVGRLRELIEDADVVIHLAGENRPESEDAFTAVNIGLTVAICDVLGDAFRANGRCVPLVLASSTQADRNNPYGRSKLAAEHVVGDLAAETDCPCIIFRFPGVFGKWCRPNYNSVVATFCHNIARGLPIQVNDPSVILHLVYVDDLVSSILAALAAPASGLSQRVVEPEYSINLGDLAERLKAFESSRNNLHIDRVGTGLTRALYATYVSYLPDEKFVYDVPQYSDPRGVFVEMLKTVDSGQFSYFTAHPGITRGGHYHHTKTEKFLVIRGEALFRFRHLITDELVELRTSGSKAEVVDTIPGWAHDITNIGSEEMIVMLWANEIFDRQNPDTVARKVE